jgi:hypothetical protein
MRVGGGGVSVYYLLHLTRYAKVCALLMRLFSAEFLLPTAYSSGLQYIVLQTGLKLHVVFKQYLVVGQTGFIF